MCGDSRRPQPRSAAATRNRKRRAYSPFRRLRPVRRPPDDHACARGCPFFLLSRAAAARATTVKPDILLVSNGYGEAAIAGYIAHAIAARAPAATVEHFPLEIGRAHV